MIGQAYGILLGRHGSGLCLLLQGDQERFPVDGRRKSAFEFLPRDSRFQWVFGVVGRQAGLYLFLNGGEGLLVNKRPGFLVGLNDGLPGQQGLKNLLQLFVRQVGHQPEVGVGAAIVTGALDLSLKDLLGIVFRQNGEVFKDLFSVRFVFAGNGIDDAAAAVGQHVGKCP